MKYIISENKFIDLVGTMTKTLYPYFNDDDVKIDSYTNGDDTYLMYRSPINSKEFYAKYYVWKKELELNRDLFETLENTFGDEGITYIIDWFNKEFDQDAESVTFY